MTADIKALNDAANVLRRHNRKEDAYVVLSAISEIELLRNAVLSATGSKQSAPDVTTKPSIWHVVISLPGLNIDHYVACPSEPTHAQLAALWRSSGGKQELRPMDWKGPLRDAYPGIASIKRITVMDAPSAPALDEVQDGAK